MQTIDVTELAKRKQQGPVDLIDVRTPAEYREVHAEGATNYPLDQFSPDSVSSSRTRPSEEPLYLICRSGARGGQATEMCLKAGIENAVNVEGGTQAWENAGLPVVRGKKTISLERQVRITAGFLVFVGTIASLYNPYFLALPAFIGAGLMFAGITDTCGMGMMLAKMPWNR